MKQTPLPSSPVQPSPDQHTTYVPPVLTPLGVWQTLTLGSVPIGPGGWLGVNKNPYN